MFQSHDAPLLVARSMSVTDAEGYFFIKYKAVEAPKTPAPTMMYESLVIILGAPSLKVLAWDEN